MDTTALSMDPTPPKAKDDDVTAGDVAQTAGGIGAGTAALKLRSDIQGLEPKLENWGKGMEEAQAAHPTDRPLTWQEADSHINKYTTGAKEVSQHKLLGARSAHIMGGARAVMYEGAPKALAGAIFQRSSAPLKRFSEYWNNPAYSGHYDMYAKPETSTPEFRTHHLADVAMPANLGDRANFTKPHHDKFVFNDEVKGVLYDTGLDAEAKYNKLKSLGHTQAAEEMKDAWLGNPAKKIRSGPQHLMGAGKEQGAASSYTSIGRAGAKYLKPAGLIGGLGGLALGAKGAYDIATKVMRRHEQPEKQAEDTSTEDNVIGGIAGAGAVASGLHAAKAFKDKPTGSVAVTYGTQPVIGSGHKEPGVAIRKILKRSQKPGDRLHNPASAGLKIAPDVVRDSEGKLKGTGERHDVLIDTGFGSRVPKAAVEDERYGGGTGSGKVMSTENAPSARRVMAYQTDLSKRDGHMYRPQSASAPALTEAGELSGYDYLAYGKGPESIKSTGFPHEIHDLKTPFSPALDPDFVDKLDTDKRNMDQVIDDAVRTAHDEHAAGVPLEKRTFQHLDPTSEHGAAQIAKLQGLKGKKVITISGSGRGDFTGVRANALHDLLQKNPEMAKEYGILALQGDGARAFDPATGLGAEGEILRRGAGQHIPHFGRVGKDMFNALQNKSHVHWGSTGTSSVSEAQMHEAVQAAPGHWGTNDRLPGTIAQRHRDALAALGIPEQRDAPNLDQWNAGNMQQMHEQPGVVRADSAEQLMEHLADKPRLDWHKQNAATRATSAREATRQGQKNLVQSVVKAQGGVASGRRKAMVRGGLGALAMGGLSAYEFMKKHNKPEVANADSR